MNFHTSRTIPLSDICKNLMGRNHGKTVLVDELILKQTYSDSPIVLNYELEYDGILIQQGVLSLSNEPIRIGLSPAARLAAPGLHQWSLFTLNSIIPRALNQAPITTELEIVLRFATEDDEALIRAAQCGLQELAEVTIPRFGV